MYKITLTIQSLVQNKSNQCTQLVQVQGWNKICGHNLGKVEKCGDKSVITVRISVPSVLKITRLRV
jgi:hypothetical protein